MPDYAKLLVHLDGTLYRGQEPIPGAVEAMSRLRTSRSILFLSNNGNHAPARLTERLHRLGFAIEPKEIICSLQLIVEAVSEMGSGQRVFTVSSGDLDNALEEAGHRVVQNGRADVVVAGVDWTFSYEKLRHALRALSSGAVLIGANWDATYPTEAGPQPAAGVFVGAMKGMGFTPAHLCGKPDPWAMRRAFEIRGFSPGPDCLLVGDRLDADIHGAQAIGIDSVVVLSGVTSERQAREFFPSPTYIADSIADVPGIIAGGE
jgi:4-nitrophenyl phosphatase